MGFYSDNLLKNIYIFGVGGVGGYFGGKIAHGAGINEEVTSNVFFIARGEHLTKIKAEGLTLNTANQGDFTCFPCLATDSIAKLPPPDLILLCVKAYDLDNAIDEIKWRVTDNTLILPLLNGVDIYERVRKKLNTGVILPSCIYVISHMKSPGIITQKGDEGVILCGPDPFVPDFNPEPLLELFELAGVVCKWRADPYSAIWTKYVFIASFGLITAYTSKTIGEVMADKWSEGLVKDIMAEICEIAAKKGIPLPEDIITKSFKRGQTVPFLTTTSFQRDVKNRRKKNEKDIFAGTIIALGKKLGVKTPVTQTVYNSL